MAEPDDSLEREVKAACEGFGRPPRILLTGKTGAGKSSLVNALLGREAQRTDVVPCTRERAQLDWSAGASELKLVDVPGFGEADQHPDQVRFILQNLPEVDMLLLVVGAPDRALDLEKTFLEDVRAVERALPVLLVGTRIDLLNPLREWDPGTLDLGAPRSPKAANIKRWSEELLRATAVPPEDLRLVSSGERFDDTAAQYGLAALQALIVERLPDAARNHAARAFQVNEVKRERAQKVIWAASVAAAVTALVPIPVGSTAVITSLQVGMVVKVALLYGTELHWRKVLGLLGPALGAILGPMAFQELVRLLPIAGSVVAAGVAGTVTLAIGMTFLYFFMHGRFQPTVEEVRERLRVEFEKARKYRDKLLDEARRARVR
ncbi:MAG: 50S ribosome-binding GTPase [Deltaproteobacteria bacterium]|nr:50S ribosome-binding GTPase [Deltaproteobacteria bacterium]